MQSYFQGDDPMKLIKCMIQPHRLDEVKEALACINIQGMTVSEVQGFGRQKGHTDLNRDAEYTVDFVPKMEIELVVADNMVRHVLDTIMTSARSGKVGDGKIFIMNVDQAVRIRTGESDDIAL
jgi:nitrogen regulatory protein P-II 1